MSAETRHEDENASQAMEQDAEPFPLSAERTPARQQIIWRNVIGIIVLHFLAVYGFVSGYRDAKLWTWIWSKYISWPVSTSSRKFPFFPHPVSLDPLPASIRSEFQINRLSTFQIFVSYQSIFIFSIPSFSFLFLRFLSTLGGFFTSFRFLFYVNKPSRTVSRLVWE